MIRRPSSARPNPISAAAHIRTRRRKAKKTAKASLRIPLPAPPMDRMSAAAGDEVRERLEKL
jgi:hypothetical protein